MSIILSLLSFHLQLLQIQNVTTVMTIVSDDSRPMHPCQPATIDRITSAIACDQASTRDKVFQTYFLRTITTAARPLSLLCDRAS